MLIHPEIDYNGDFSGENYGFREMFTVEAKPIAERTEIARKIYYKYLA